MTRRVPVYTLRLEREGAVSTAEDSPQLTDASAAVRALRALIPDDGREHFCVALLSVRKRVLGVHEISIGTLSSSLVHPRETFTAAILAKAAYLILCHNHPSGDPEPSSDDVSLTQRLCRAGEILGIEVLDHVILGDGSHTWVSLRTRGLM